MKLWPQSWADCSGQLCDKGRRTSCSQCCRRVQGRQGLFCLFKCSFVKHLLSVVCRNLICDLEEVFLVNFEGLFNELIYFGVVMFSKSYIDGFSQVVLIKGRPACFTKHEYAL